jgi:hypothetical protein
MTGASGGTGDAQRLVPGYKTARWASVRQCPPNRRVCRALGVRSLPVKKDYFGEEVAARYDGGPMFSPDVLDPMG